MKYTYTIVASLIVVLFTVPTLTCTANANYKSEGQIGFYPGQRITPPVNPNNPDPNSPVSPEQPDGTQTNSGTGSPLSLDFVSTFEFDTQTIDDDRQVIYAKAQKFAGSKAKTPTYIQLTDNRGSRSGWSLRIVQVGKKSALKGATLLLKNPVAISNNNAKKPIVYQEANLVPDAQAVIASAPVESGVGTWVIRWGEQADLLTNENAILTPNVELIVPEIEEKKLTTYSTTLNWILSNLPVMQ